MVTAGGARAQVNINVEVDRDEDASGLEWKPIGATMPSRGRELSHPDLATALRSKVPQNRPYPLPRISKR